VNVIDIRVRYSCQAYVTNATSNQRSSSTSSAASAAALQAEKLFGPSLQRLELVDETMHSSVWRATADADEFAWAWANGVIEFGTVVPEDACHFASGPRRALMAQVAVIARHGHTKGQLLVPGIPEAKGQKAAMDALLDFETLAASRNGKKGSWSVLFGKAARKDAPQPS
jgi:hypothetical protein